MSVEKFGKNQIKLVGETLQTVGPFQGSILNICGRSYFLPCYIDISSWHTAYEEQKTSKGQFVQAGG